MNIATRRHSDAFREHHAAYEGLQPYEPPTEEVRAHLSSREFEIARLASEGLSNKEIALVLQISHHTVSTHLRRIYDKLGLNRRACLARYLVGQTVRRIP